MPLSQSQKEFILSAIGYLLEFPTTREALVACAKQIADSLCQNTLSNAGDYTDLCRCILHPTETLKRLDDYNDKDTKVTIGEVKIHLLELITQHFNAACQILNITLVDLDWNVETLAATLALDPAFPSEFKSMRGRTPDQLPPWENIRHQDSLYHASLSRNTENQSIKLKIRIALPGESRLEAVDDFYRAPDENVDEYELLCRLIPSARQEAEKRTLAFVKYYLTNRQLLTSQQITKLFLTPVLKPLLVDSVYVSFLLQKTIKIDSLLSLTEDKVNLLRQPFTKSVLLNQLCSFETAVQHTAIELQLMLIYSSEIKRKQIPASKFQKLTETQTKTLSLPIVCNLVKTQTLQIDKALLFPAFVHAVFTSDLYADYISKLQIDWGLFSFMKSHHTPFLLNPAVALMFKERVLSVNSAIFFSASQCEVLSNPKCIELLMNKILRPGHLLRASGEALNLFLNHPVIHEALIYKVMTLNEIITNAELQKDRAIEPRDLNQIYIKIFNQRLKMILDHQPLRYKDSIDNTTSLLMDFLSTTIRQQIDDSLIHHQIIVTFISAIQLKLAEITLENIKTNQPTHQRALLSALSASYHPAQSPKTRAIGLLKAAHETLAQLEMPPPTRLTLFSPTSTTTNPKIIALCKVMIDCESILRIDEELTETLDQSADKPELGKVIHL